MLRQKECLGEAKGDPDPLGHAIIIKFYVVTCYLLNVSDFKADICDDNECELHENGQIVVLLPANHYVRCYDHSDKNQAIDSDSFPIFHITNVG